MSPKTGWGIFVFIGSVFFIDFYVELFESSRKGIDLKKLKLLYD